MPIKNRAVKFRVNDAFTKEIIPFYKQQCNIISRLLYPRIINGEIDFTKQVKFVEGPIIKELKEALPFGSSWQRTLVRSVLERYRSFYKRNRIIKRYYPSSVILFKDDRAISLRSGVIKTNKNRTEFRIKNPFTKKLQPFNMKVLGTMGNYVPYVSTEFGGNLKIKDSIFIARASIPYEWTYIPEEDSFIGTDVNKRHHVFLVAVATKDGEKIVLPHNTQLVDIIEDIANINHEIGNRKRNNKIKSKKRIRRLVQREKLRSKMKYEIKEYISKVIEFTKEKKAILCIDKAHTGTTNGTYGQDEIINGLERECENQRIPFVVVPPSYSSELCNICSAITDRPVDELIICPNCGSIDADENGARNIANFGKLLLELDNNKYEFKKTIRERRTKAKQQAELLEVV